MTIKKKIILSLAIIIFVAIAALTTIIILNSINKKTTIITDTTDKSQQIAAPANDYEIKADTAAAAGDTTTAKTLYDQAKQVYTQDAQSSNQATIDAKLYLLENPPATPEPAPPLYIQL
jgi:hypothetical protein